jgi:hypothetical protein
MRVSTRALPAIAFGTCLCLAARAEEFFAIRETKVHETPEMVAGPQGKKTPDMTGIWEKRPLPAAAGKRASFMYEFVPSLEVIVETRLRTRGKDTFAHLYVFDTERKLLKPMPLPTPVRRSAEVAWAVPFFYEARKPESLFFPIPKEATGKKWTAVAVFGDTNEVAVKMHPPAAWTDYDFPEKDLATGKTKQFVDRKEAVDPVIEHPVTTGNSKQPLITLFLRFPSKPKAAQGATGGAGMKPSAVGQQEFGASRAYHMSEGTGCDGVLALCMLANKADQIRHRLEGISGGLGVDALVNFAEKNRLAILAWGSCPLWDPGTNFDEMDADARHQIELSFDKVADGWEAGVRQLNHRYGLPLKGYLLWGCSGSAQWAHRLAVRKPDHFLAAHIHVPSSFDEPTPEAARVMWCLTTGELESGYERSLRFYAACRRMGYPMVYKAVTGLGHERSAQAAALGLRFFEYALGARAEREASDRSFSRASLSMPREGEMREPWPESFQKPAFIGDLVNQEVFPSAEREMVPEGFRVPLPTEELAEAWKEPEALPKQAAQ